MGGNGWSIMKKIILFLFLALILFPLVYSADCDYSKLDECVKQKDLLLQDYLKLNNSFTSLDNNYSELLRQVYQLNITLMNISSERDFYKESYLNSSIVNLTVRDFVDLTQNIENHYMFLDRRILNFNQTMNEFIEDIGFKLTLSFSLFSFALIGGIFSICFTIYHIKKYSNKFEQIISKITIHEKGNHKPHSETKKE